MKKIVKFFAILISAVLGLVLALYIVIFQASPWPASMIVRRAFEDAPARPPTNYDEILSSIDTHLDLEYPSAYARNTLDLFCPHDADSPLPVVIWVHGGAFVGGDKADVRYYTQTLSASGYAVVAMNYLRAPEGNYPSVLLQLDEVYQYLKTVSDDFGLDVNRIVLAGDSAGAQIVAQAAALLSNPDYAQSLSFSMSIPRESLRGVLLYCGPFSISALTESSSSHIWTQLIKMIGWSYFGDRGWQKTHLETETSVLFHVTSDFPPAFVTDGNTFSFERQGREMVAALRSLDVPVTELFFDINEHKTVHIYQFLQDTIPGQMSVEETVRFLETVNGR